MIDEDDCGAIGGMKIGRGNRSTRRKPGPAPLCPPQIPHDQTRARTPGRRGGKPPTSRLSYGAALRVNITTNCSSMSNSSMNSVPKNLAKLQVSQDTGQMNGADLKIADSRSIRYNFRV
jgi:hypothetical protein